MNNAVLEKTMENIRKHRDIKLVTTDKKTNKLVSEPNHHTINYISEDLSIIEMRRMKIDKCKKLVCNLHNKKKYVVHIKSLKQALNHGLKLKRVHRIIEFNQKAWLKPYIDMNTELRKLAKDDFEKDLFINEQCSIRKNYGKH